MVSLGPLAKCSTRELVKVKVDDATEWAIVGARDPGYSPLIFLTGENAPLVINVEPELSDFSEQPVAKYGTEYRFVHDPNGPARSEMTRFPKLSALWYSRKMVIGISWSTNTVKRASDGWSWQVAKY